MLLLDCAHTFPVQVLSHIIIREVDNLSAAVASSSEEGSAEEEGVFDGLNGPIKTTRGKVPSYVELMRQM
jgi:hypothetical protein